MATTGKRPLSLYFHIPFCRKKCPYCHFYVIRDNEDQKNRLLECFFKELFLLKIPADSELISIYFGGGTPSLFGPKRIKDLLQFIYQQVLPYSQSCEITLEANPEDVNLEKMTDFKQAGINRVSLGVQSLHDESLVQIGRKHSSQKAIDAIFATFHAGITNISIDLMYDRPFQTNEQWLKELDLLQDLPITHLSLYNMTIEEGSAYKRHEKKIRQKMPDSDLSYLLHTTALSKLQAAGFERYEISAFCKHGAKSKHNLGYWQGRDFLGLGPSAFSYFDKKRFKNISNFKFYEDAIFHGKLAYDFEETLDPIASLKEMLCIGLRVREGVFRKDFENKYGLFPIELERDIQVLIEKDYITISDGWIRLTDQGMLFYDEVGATII